MKNLILILLYTFEIEFTLISKLKKSIFYLSGKFYIFLFASLFINSQKKTKKTNDNHSSSSWPPILLIFPTELSNISVFNNLKNSTLTGFCLDMTENPSSNKSTKSNDHEFNLTRLTIPVYMCHFKVGHALCSNDTLLIAQNGPTTIEVRMPPKFEPKQVPWHEGLLRDSIWCSQLNVFVFLTQKSLFSFDPKLLFTRSAMTDEERLQSSINAYSTIKPYDDKNSFWRCTCAGTTLYITYSGKRIRNK